MRLSSYSPPVLASKQRGRSASWRPRLPKLEGARRWGLASYAVSTRASGKRRAMPGLRSVVAKPPESIEAVGSLLETLMYSLFYVPHKDSAESSLRTLLGARQRPQALRLLKSRWCSLAGRADWALLEAAGASFVVVGMASLPSTGSSAARTCEAEGVSIAALSILSLLWPLRAVTPKS